MKYLFIFLFCFPILCQAEDFYVFIDKIGKVTPGEEAGHTEYGDVVAIQLCIPQYNPTRAELDRYKVIIMDLTEEEKETLMEPEQVIDEIVGGYRTVRAKKRKLKIDKLKDIKQKEKVNDKSKVFDQLITKPSITP